METMQMESEDKKELDDSGCVQDVGPPQKNAEKGVVLLDLSDDVLLYILQYCTPRDLKALGYTCPRLGRLIKDRTLWCRVDARDYPTGRARMRWLLAHALGSNTTELLLTGYAREAKGCLGHVNRNRKEVEDEHPRELDDLAPTASTSEQGCSRSDPVQIIQVDPLTRLQRLYSQPRFTGCPTWPEECIEDRPEEDEEDDDSVYLNGPCPGPQFTLTQCMLQQLSAHCSLTSLGLQYCNINCNTTGIYHFPPTLKKLSLRGAKCYNLPLDKSFLFNIQDHLPRLEHLDLSECEWLEPAALLPLSKVGTLTHLLMRDCYRLSEFVAYASLATRYGFRQLLHLDLRGSPVGDSEVSALGWLPSLQELFVSSARAAAPAREHSHYRDDPVPAHAELEPWELEEPEYFMIKPQMAESVEIGSMTSLDDLEERMEQMREYENNICLHGLEYNLCMDGIRKPSRNRQEHAAGDETGAQESEPEEIEEDIYPPEKKKGKKSKKNETLENTVKYPKDEEFKEQVDDAVLKEEENNPQEKVETPNEEEKESKVQASDYEEERKSLDGEENELAAKDESGSSPEKSDDSGPAAKRRRVERVNQQLKKGVIWTGEYLVKKIRPHKDDQAPSCSSKNDGAPKRKPDTDSSEDEDMQFKMLCKKRVNEGASTSQSPPTENPKCKKPNEHPKDCKCKEQVYEFVRFRQNMDPVIVRREASEIEREVRENREREIEMGNQNREVPPRAHVLYVNVGQQLHTVYRLSIQNEPPIFYSFARNSHLRFRPNVGNIFYTPPAPHVDPTSLVTDSAIRRFGRADGENIGYINIGTGRGVGDPIARPNRSSLRVLSVTGFSTITDRSLVHLATAAPNLEFVDFSETRVTAQGVENFKGMRPDCEVQYSEYVEREE